MREATSLKNLLPWLAGAVILLGAWFLPIPSSIFGAEQLSADKMPQTRATVESYIADFQKAKRTYYDFIQTHDMAAISGTLQSALVVARANPSDPALLAAVRDPAVQIRDYTAALAGYSEAGDKLFPQLRFYDDELMSYTRSYTPPTDQVRALTYPLADIIRLYPPPVGDLMPDPPWIYAPAIKAQLASITAHINDLNPNPDPHAEPPPATATLDALKQDVSAIWESGRSVEEVGLQHTKYLDRLQSYDTRIQAVIKSQGDSSLTSGRKVLALGLNIAVGLALAAGIAFLLQSKLRHENGAAS